MGYENFRVSISLSSTFLPHSFVAFFSSRFLSISISLSILFYDTLNSFGHFIKRPSKCTTQTPAASPTDSNHDCQVNYWADLSNTGVTHYLIASLEQLYTSKTPLTCGTSITMNYTTIAPTKMLQNIQSFERPSNTYSSFPILREFIILKI